MADEGQPAGVRFVVDAAAIGGAFRLGQYAGALVVADGLDVDAAPFGQCPDRHHGNLAP